MDVDVKRLKEAYKKLYKKSRESDLPSYMQDTILERLVDENLLKALDNQIKENPDISREKLKEKVFKIKELIDKWKDELDKRWF